MPVTASIDAVLRQLFPLIHCHAQVVPLKQLTLSELSQHDGSKPDKPMYLAIRGTVFDVTIGAHSFSACLLSRPQCATVSCIAKHNCAAADVPKV